MDELTRRRFLVASGVTGAAALAAGGAVVSWREVASRLRTDPLPGDANVLVLVTLYGGNDALGTVVPYADDRYHDARPDLAYDAEDVLELGDDLGLSPSMKGLHRLWRDERLAIVRGVGYPDSDRSHFTSMDVWQTASPDAPVPTGWIGRWLDGVGDPLRALSLGPTLPPLAVGEHLAAGALPLGRFSVPDGALAAALARLGAPDPADSPAHALAARGTADYLRLGRSVAEKLKEVRDDPDSDDERDANGASAGGQGALGAQLAAVRGLIEAGGPAQVYSVSLGGFDTHADERATQERLLGELDEAVAGFLGAMARSERGRTVVVAVYSEFGRRVAANAAQGTDHGTAGVMLVAGAPVRGGFYGEQPSLARLDDGDLAVTTDFRAVYATLLAGVLDTDPARILTGGTADLGFL